jgi:hypothetical protein
VSQLSYLTDVIRVSIPGQCLNFNCMFVLVLMLRQCITFLRTRGYSSMLPLDQHIYFHKLTGMFIFGYSFLHTIMHVCNFSLVVVNAPGNNFTTNEWLFSNKPRMFGLVPGLANPTGFALFFILLVMIVCSQAFVRRGGCFEVSSLLDTNDRNSWWVRCSTGPT